MPPGLGEILAESGDLTLRRLRKASDWRRAHGGTIDRALLATGAVSEETLLDALERLTGIPSVSRERLASASAVVVDTLPAETRRRLRALPFDRRGDVLHVAVVDPGNPVLETGLVASTGCEIRLHVTADPILEDLLLRFEPLGARDGGARAPGAPPVAPAEPPGAGRRPPPERVEAPPEPDPFARLARALLADALDEGASAVEIGPEGRGVLLRTYAAGRTLSTRPLPSAVLAPLLAWLLARSRPSGPFDDGGLFLQKGRRRVRVEVSVNAAGTAWLVLEPGGGEGLEMGAAEICLHEGAEGDVFCPSCGAAL